MCSIFIYQYYVICMAQTVTITHNIQMYTYTHIYTHTCKHKHRSAHTFTWKHKNTNAYWHAADAHYHQSNVWTHQQTLLFLAGLWSAGPFLSNCWIHSRASESLHLPQSPDLAPTRETQLHHPTAPNLPTPPKEFQE